MRSGARDHSRESFVSVTAISVTLPSLHINFPFHLVLHFDQVVHNHLYPSVCSHRAFSFPGILFGLFHQSDHGHFRTAHKHGHPLSRELHLPFVPRKVVNVGQVDIMPIR
ncbi:hypothetical protein LCGC14_2602660 [marine sediment metagenome]|uniref:Uncharacterized protein n=1 Tax=marine sediment metagenome TaxID=412755 RepID=A0A0F9CJB4_9ZZZZ